jgi:hypothetical protein
MKNSSDTIGKRTRDLPACIAVPQLTAPPRAPSLSCTEGKQCDYSYIQRGLYSDWLWAGRFGDRIPVEARFSFPAQIGPKAHPASCTMGTVFLSGVKRPERGFDHPRLSSAELRTGRSYTSTFHLCLHRLSWCVLYLLQWNIWVWRCFVSKIQRPFLTQVSWLTARWLWQSYPDE